MRSVEDIKDLLNELEFHVADDLEDQDLDFKEWNSQSVQSAYNTLIDMAICMANGGGGTVVFGIRDRGVGRENAIIGVPPEIDINRLKREVYEHTDPRITPVFEEINVVEGTGRILVMQIYPGMPPYTDTSGRGRVRVGKDCQPLTGTMRRRIMVETGTTDFSATITNIHHYQGSSNAALEYIREAARREQAPEELLKANDHDFLLSLGIIQQDKLTRAGLMLVGKEAAIRAEVPGYVWTYLKMKNDTEYIDRLDGHDAIPIALYRIMDRIMADNPITTMQYGMFHFEYRTYPEIALRETLMNAFCHADYRIGGPIIIKHYPNRIEISNPGGFIGGITPENILHHQPMARNPHLVEVLTRLRLVNRSSLGISRIYRAMIMEGKQPPIIQEDGDAVKVTLLAGKFTASFRAFVAEEENSGHSLEVDHLLILQYLMRHAEIDTATAARICQRNEEESREILSNMEIDRGYLERGGVGKGTYWHLSRSVHTRLMVPGNFDVQGRIDWDAAKTRVLSVLMQRSSKREAGLSNADIRQITAFNRDQVIRLMKELRDENPRVHLSKRGRYSSYYYK